MISAQLWMLAMILSVVSASNFRVIGHITHGINTFNDRPLADFSASSKLFARIGTVHEIGVLKKGGKNASIITDNVSPGTPMATIDSYELQEGLGFPSGLGPFNIPISTAPTLFTGSKTINDRMKPKPFAESSDLSTLGLPYLSKEADAQITLQEWNCASARIYGSCNNGRATFKVQIKNGLPNGVYTMLDVGISNPLTAKEVPSVGPFGGLPNILTTDEKGNGSLRRQLNYCPTEKCQGMVRCTLYASLFYHFDHMVYGGSPALDHAGQAIGMVGSNQIQFFFNARPIRPPQNKF